MRKRARQLAAAACGTALAVSGVVVYQTPAQAISDTFWGTGTYVIFYEREHANSAGATGMVYKTTQGCTVDISGWDVSVNSLSTWNNQISSFYAGPYSSPYAQCVSEHFDGTSGTGATYGWSKSSSNMGTFNDKTSSTKYT